MRNRSDDTVNIIGACVVALFVAVACFVVIMAAIHDAKHCTRWVAYTYEDCTTTHYGYESHTVCTPVNAKRCTAWDDVS